MHLDKHQIIADLDSARARLDAAIASLDSSEMIYPRWRLKELLDHIAGWDDAVLTALRSHAAGETPVVSAPRGIDYYNAQTVSRRETIPLEHTRREYEVTRRLLKQIILEMADERFSQPLVYPWGPKGTVWQMMEVFVEHEHEHAEDLEKLVTSHSNYTAAAG